MESIRQVTKRYNKLLVDVATKDFYKVDLTNRVNCYVCSNCGHVTKTKDIAPGVTPMIITCEKCQRITARSTFYKDIVLDQEPTIEWYRPDLKETLKTRRYPNLLEHILSGGLCHREIKHQ